MLSKQQSINQTCHLIYTVSPSFKYVNTVGNENYLQCCIKLKRIWEISFFLQFNFYNDISFTWIVLNEQVYLCIIEESFNMDFSAIVFFESMTWVYLVGCPWNYSQCQQVGKWKFKDWQMIQDNIVIINPKTNLR